MHKHGGDIYRNVGVIDYSANINPGGLPEAVIEAAIQGVRYSTHYPDVECEKLREHIAIEEGVPVDYIRCGNGAADIIFSLVIALKPKKALLPAPSFYEYEQALRAMDCEVEYFYLKEEEGFVPGEDLIDAIKPGIDMMFICNPNNPTGVLLDKDYLKRLLDKCQSCGTYMILDECFNDLIEEPDKYTCKEYLAGNDRLLILKAFTKLYAMPGLRLGYGLCSDKAVFDKMKEVSQPWSVSIPAQMAGIAALKEKEYVLSTKADIKKEKARLVEGLKDLGLKVYGYGANYIFFKARPGFHNECLDRKIMVRNCGNYEGLEEGYYRIAVRGAEDNNVLLKVFEEILK